MGFYSFYRIIKDITKTIFGSKVWRFTLIILIVFTILFIMGGKGVFAASFEIDGIIYDLPSWVDQNGYNYIIFYKDLGNIFLYDIILTTTDNFRMKNNSDSYSIYSANSTRILALSSSSNKQNFQSDLSSLTLNSFTSRTYELLSKSYYSTDYVFSNVEVKDYTSGDTVIEPSQITIHPSFDTPKSDIENLSFDYLFVSPGSWDLSSPLYLHRLEITQTVNDYQNVIYYYGDKIFRLDTTSPYYTQYLDSDIYYFSIRKSKFNFDVNTSYLLVIDDSPELYTNSVGLIEKDWDNNIFDVASINTTGIITAQDVIKDNTDNISDDLTNTSPDSSVSSDIDDALNFDNQNEGLNDLNGGFFTRLTTMLSNLLGYNLAEDTTVSIPLPNSNNSIVLHSNIIYNNVTGALRLIINAFWVYIFSFYMWKFINKIYIAVSTGNILDTFSSSGEAITNDML